MPVLDHLSRFTVIEACIGYRYDFENQKTLKVRNSGASWTRFRKKPHCFAWSKEKADHKDALAKLFEIVTGYREWRFHKNAQITEKYYQIRYVILKNVSPQELEIYEKSGVEPYLVIAELDDWMEYHDQLPADKTFQYHYSEIDEKFLKWFIVGRLAQKSGYLGFSKRWEFVPDYKSF